MVEFNEFAVSPAILAIATEGVACGKKMPTQITMAGRIRSFSFV